MLGRLFILSAPSGAGKTTVSRRLQAAGLARVSVSHTTRPPRPGEENGREYFFVDRRQFAAMRDAGIFLESAEVYGNLYGTSAEWVRDQLARGQNVLLEIDPQGARNVKRNAPDAVSIFLRPPSVQALRDRLQRRGQDSAEVVARRLAAARDEIARQNEYDCVIINDNLEKAVAQAQQILLGKGPDSNQPTQPNQPKPDQPNPPDQPDRSNPTNQE